MDDYVDFYELATRLGVSYDTVRRSIAKYGDEIGITVQKLKTPSSKGALTQCISESDANTLITFLENRSKSDQAESGNENDISFRRFGYFYIIQIVPELSPNRVKIGYTDNLDQRLREHQTSAPTAKFVKHWACKRAWDQAVMDSITREGCALILNEVYEGDINSFVSRADAFFALMPGKETRVPLAEISPLRESTDEDE